MTRFRESTVTILVVNPEGQRTTHRVKLAFDTNDSGIVIVPLDIPDMAGYVFKVAESAIVGARNGKPVERIVM
jgi:hypothetical protein